MTVRKLLFVCTGNGGRSPMAKLLFEHMAKRHANPIIRRLVADSAGTCASASPDTELVPALERLGISEVEHAPKQVTRELVDWADLVLTMTEDHQRWIQKRWPDASSKAYVFREYVGEKGDIQDPWHQGVEAYVRVGKELQTLIRRLFEKLAGDGRVAV